ncbi:MAG: chromosome segregation protein SMC [Verrucomicrobiae bacterium]|nr:chromosome segregation protein SMC [Verrucomicrobiae bacterium]
MYLKNIQILGFKSFADKTNVEFLPGITAIVGPNGCGKSNVCDSIRWVLGEQSAKALRSDEMAGVIFNGSDKRKPTAMAEVHLTFADCKDVLHTGHLAGVDANFDEVTVTRRVFRDGSSEYFINKSACRLKDVQSLFMDTGIGRSSYSIMEQGKIARILSASAQERRLIFEEAAGITKFKQQKKEAMRKLEYTEANLLRVSDIIREVKRQIGSLQRQASKARRYQALIAELKHLDVQLARHEYEKIQGAIKTIEADVLAFSQQLDEARFAIEKGETDLNEFRRQAGETEQRRQETVHQQNHLRNEAERLQIHIKTNTDRIRETEAAIQTAENEARETRAQWTELTRQLETTRTTLQTSQQQLERQTQDLEQAQQQYREADRIAREHEAVIQNLQNALLNLEGVLANLRNQVSALERQRQEIDTRHQKLTVEKNGIGEERFKLQQRLDSLQTEIQSFKLNFEASRTAVTGGETALNEANLQCQTLAAKIGEEEKILSEKRTRQELLRQLQESYEGYSEGNQALLKWLREPATPENPKPGPEHAIGALANMIEVEPRFSTSIEAALGQSLQAIIVTQTDAAIQLVHRLHTQDWGLATLAINNGDCHNVPSIPVPTAPIEGTITWAHSVVKAHESVTHLVSRLLADTVIVADIDTALRLRSDNPSLTYVTLKGDVIDSRGIVTSGSRKVTTVQLIGRRNEIAALAGEISRYESSLQQLNAQKGEWEARLSAIRQNLGAQQSELRLQETDLTKKDTLLGAMQGNLRDLDNRLSTISWEIDELEKQKVENETSQQKIRQELADAGVKQTEAQAACASARDQAAAFAAERDTRNEAVNNLRIARATNEEQIRGHQVQASSIERQLQQLQQTIDTRETDARAGKQRIVQWEGEIAQSGQQINSLQQEAATFDGKIAAIVAEKQHLDREIEKAAESVRVQRNRIEDFQRKLTHCEVQVAEHRGDLNHLSDRIRREHDTDLAMVALLPFEGAVPEPAQQPAPEEKPAAAGENQEQDPSSEAAPEPPPAAPVIDRLNFADWDQVALRITELRDKLQGIGPVNLDAVQEYDELEQRHTFLEREYNDLVTSKEQLLQILQKINETSRQMFADTFNTIRTNFQQTFIELFGGGVADLNLIEGEDPLEAGVEIMARPPGKKPQTITLLSGGEQTLTAVALLFAIYMVKPSPFCVLDELDAPLDESNIDRFTGMLKRFLKHSQFVIITHSKRTISIADAIYGVTMEERGVSKVVSVKFTGLSKGASKKPDKKSDAPQETSPSENETPPAFNPVAKSEQPPEPKADEQPLAAEPAQ